MCRRGRNAPLRPLWWLAGLTLSLAACNPSPSPTRFELAVTFAGRLQIEPGADVRYQGVRVGEVTLVSLRQARPNRPAFVQLSLAIDPSVTLREGDDFEVTSDGSGPQYVRVTPSPDPSPPLVAGTTVTGTPPFVTEVRESVRGALKSLTDFAREEQEELRRAIEGADGTKPEP